MYDIYGNAVSTAYDISGKALDSANDIGETLRVMSYNVQRWEGSNALSSIQDVAFGQGASIIGIQEWGYNVSASATIGGTSIAGYLAAKGYSNLYVSEQSYNKTAVASKNGLADMSETVYTQSIETRSYTKSYFTFGGKRIAFFNTHLDYQAESAIKFQQAKELLAAVAQEETFILTGDLNTTVQSASENEFVQIVKPFIDAGYNVANGGAPWGLLMTCYNGTTVEGSSQITPPDNIITSADIEIVNVYLDTTKLTVGTGNVIDHIPLIADLRIN